MSLVIRQATAEDLPWANGCYARVSFQPARLDRQTLLVGELDGRRVGLGRLVHLADGSAELGGMFVDEEARGHGVAGQIVERLIVLGGSRRLYCIPFEHLSGFYQRYGFVPAEPGRPLPEEISGKLRFCEETYPQKAVLLVREPARA
jgi:GNAT superfamily N-acetyltransferase